MKTVLNVLKEKLNTLGYNEAIINSTLSKFDLALIENATSEIEDVNEIITIEEYDEPNVEIIRMFLDVNNDMLQCEVLEGDIKLSATESAVGTRFAIADYTISRRNAIIGITNNFKIKIIVYRPTPKIQNLYNKMTYEQVYKKERDEVTLSYYDAFVDNVTRSGKATARKVKEIITLLVSDFVIDEIAIKDLNPRFKMYDNEYKYAENIYSYSIRYINLKTNRVEFFEKDANIKMISKNVQAGIISNDPYIKVDKPLVEADFPLNTVSYYWIGPSKGVQEQIAIFISPKVYEHAMFSELKKEDPRIENIARDLTRRFKKETNLDVDFDDIRDVLQKLNFELMCPSVDIIRANMPNKMDPIEPIKYKYKIITDPAEFEEKLYISIEDHMAKRYRYKLVENVLEDLTTIGNKLEYTDESGAMVRKQSVADFNVNMPAVVIRRETFIGADGIPDLLGYIYQDMKYYGTDALPVPNIEVVFYMPPMDSDRGSVAMYNGTNLEFSIENISNQNFFNSEQVSGNNSYVIGGEAVLPGSTTVTVRCLNSKDEILKENVIANVFPKTSYLPDIFPIINDKDGKEWVLENSNIIPTILSAKADENIVEIKYIEKYARVSFSFINREGKKIVDDKQELVQVGTNYDFSSKQICRDMDGEDWKLLNTRPTKLIVSEAEEKNKVILLYDIERADIIIKFINRVGEQIAEDKIVQSTVEKLYKADSVPYIVDQNGLGWSYVEGSNATVFVKNTEPNVITLIYEEAKQKVVTRIKNEEGIPLVDDEIVFIQIGKKYAVNFDKTVLDLECKEWKLSNAIVSEIIVDKDGSKNLLEAVYEPRLSKVAIKFVDLDGRQIREAAIEQAQIGARFNAGSMGEILDSFGKVWVCKEGGMGIVISESERENTVTLKYEPLMAKVTLKYYDTESNELIAPKYEMLQVGTVYKNKPMMKITDESGKRWIIDESKVPTITVNEHEEENIVSIYYDKENTKITITFYDAFGNSLRESQDIDSQIGAVYDSSLFLKITDNQGVKWMLESSEPKNLIVREGGNNFKFIYGEVKTKVLVRHIDIATQKAIVEDVISTIKLGGIFVPNIRQKILDKNKWQWKYIGDENITIVTKENEQENIIILNYEEDKSDVVLKYQTLDGTTIRADAVKQIQIGKEIKIDHVQKLNDNNGLGWKFVKSSVGAQIVKPEENIIIDSYEPLLAKVITKYVCEENTEIVQAKEEDIQVGKKFTPDLLNRITDKEHALWSYVSVSEDEIIVKEDVNVIECKYEKTLAETTVRYIDEYGDLLADPIASKYQIGTIFAATIEKNIEDKEGKAWIFDGVDHEKITVQEDSEKNVINVAYKKEMVDLKLCFFGTGLQTIKGAQIVKVQIGSMYIAKPMNIIIDDKSLGWELREELIPRFKVSRNPAENVVNISYDKYLVDAIVQFIDDNNNVIIAPSVTKHQVGTSFMPEIEDYIEDKEGKEWVYAAKVENKIFTMTKKVEPIVISEAVGKNVIKLHYKPSMNKVTIKYKDPMGNDIKMQMVTEAQIGSNYTPEIIKNIVGAGNVKWVYNPNSKSTIRINRDPGKNVINLAYEEQKATVIYKYVDENNNVLRDEKKQLAQIGSIHRVDPENIVESSDGRVWEYKAKSLNEVKVDDDEANNVVEIVYMPLKVDVVLKFITLNGNTIIPNQIVKAQLGSDYKAPVEQTIIDDESRMYKFVKIEPASIKVKEIPLGKEENNDINVFEITYESSFSEARIVFKDIDGNKLRDDEIKQMQVGTMFAPSPIQYITDRKGIQWELINDKIDPIRIMDDVRQNQITMVYEVAKAEISVRFKDMDGNTIREAKLFYLEVGREFVPEVENEIEDSQNRKWIYMMTDPVKLTVGSINNIINIVYQEKKAMTVVKVQTTDGTTLRDDVKTKLQIGSKYVPVPVTKVIYDNNNNIWRYAFNSPSDIIVSENAEENVIIQYFTTDDSAKKEDTSKAFNPDISRFIDEDLVAEAEREEAEKKKKEDEEAQKKATMPTEEIVNFTDPYLQALERSMKLTNAQKGAINKLNDYNTNIVKLLHEALDYTGNLDGFNLAGKLDKLIHEEKENVTSGLADLIEEDRTGNKILKIFEAITSSEMSDKDFNFLQQKKAILFADYFVNKGVSEIEEITYIVERGKNDKGLECINQKIAESKHPTSELLRMKVILIYEKMMLDNYYRARSLIKDEYFKNEESKAKMSREVIVSVTNILPNQAIKLFNKCLNLSLAQRNELDAIMKLLNSQQLTTVQNGINKIADGKIRKIAIKLYKEIAG